MLHSASLPIENESIGPTNGPYAICTDPQNPAESRRPGRVLNVQDPIVFSAISTKEWGLRNFIRKPFSDKDLASH